MSRVRACDRSATGRACRTGQQGGGPRSSEPVVDGDGLVELAERDRILARAEQLADLGLSDQAHPRRLFAAVVGTPPATYRRDA